MSIKGSAKKLPKAERRDQLLDAAMTIVREEGADALTLGRLAERAGVSKPVVYDHFGAREGLLIALYRRIDERHVAALRKALRRLPSRLEDVAQAVGAAYVSCASSIGPEWHALTAALKGADTMEIVQRELVENYVGLYQEALAPFSQLSPDELRLRCVGVIGAAEAISREVTRGETSETRATATLTALIVAVIESRQ